MRTRTQEPRNKDQGTRNKEQETRNKKQETNFVGLNLETCILKLDTVTGTNECR